jgi:HEAT repeat protein
MCGLPPIASFEPSTEVCRPAVTCCATRLLVLLVIFLIPGFPLNATAQTDESNSLILDLQSSNSQVRIEAAHRLGQLRASRAVPALIGAMNDDDFKVQQAAKDALVRIGTSAVDSLISTLNQGDDAMSAKAAQCLGRIKDHRAIHPLVVALARHFRGGYNVASEAADALVLIGGPAVVDALIPVLTTGNRIAKVEATSILGKLRDPRAVEPLIAVLHSGDSDLWGNVALALGQIGDPRAVEPLLGLLTGAPDHLKPYAIDGLCKIPDPRVPEALLKATADQNDFVRTKATQALQRMAYKPSSLQDRVILLLSAGQSDSVASLGPEVQPILFKLLKSGATGLRAGAASALAKFQNPLAVENLVNALQDKDPEVRENAAKSLGIIKNPTCIGHLIPLLMDPDYFVRQNSRGALRGFGDPKASAAIAAADAFWAPARTKADVLTQKGSPSHKGYQDTPWGSLETWVYRERCVSSIHGRGSYYFIHFDSSGNVKATSCGRSLTIERWN